MVSRIGILQDMSSNHLNVYDKPPRKSADALIADFVGDETIVNEQTAMCHQPLHIEALVPPLVDKSFEDYLHADASMERCIESILNGTQDDTEKTLEEPLEPVVFPVDAKQPAISPSARVRRRSPIMEVTIDADNDGHERETVLAGHVHIEQEDDDASACSDISCDDESECEFFRICDHHVDVMVVDDDEEISIGVFIELLNIVEDNNSNTIEEEEEEQSYNAAQQVATL